MPLERRGILSVNPSADLLPAPRDPVKRAIGISQDLYNVFNTHYDNKLKEAQGRSADLDAQKKSGTLQSDIEATNTRNNTDIKYYPQIQAMELAKAGASVKEIQARTGLSYAEAGAARARAAASYADANKTNMNASPMAAQQAAYEKYKQAPEGSDEQRYYAGILRDQMGKYGQVPGGGGGAVPTGQMGGGAVPPTPQGGAVPMVGSAKDPRFGSNRMGAGGTYINEDGTEVSTPTNATTTKNQASIQALQRVTPIIKDLSKNIAQFQTLKNKGALHLQTLGNLMGGDYPLPNQMAKAQEDLDLAPESLLKAYTITPTDKSLATMRSAVTPRVGETTKGLQNRLVETLEMLKASEEEAKQAQAKGFDVTQPGGQGQGQPQQPQELFYNPPKPQVASGFNGNPNVPPAQPPAQPAQPQAQPHPVEFESKAQAKAYFNSLSPEEKQRYLASLPE